VVIAIGTFGLSEQTLSFGCVLSDIT